MAKDVAGAGVAPGTAVVTGASSGIGRDYAERLAGLGHDLVLVARRQPRLAELADRLRREHGVRTEVLVADLSQDEDVSRVAGRVAADDVSVLVNNAAINGYGPYAATDAALHAKVIAVNVAAVAALSRAVLPGMLERGAGTLVNVASLLAFSGSLPPVPGGLPERVVYGGTKGFVVAFTRLLAAELADTPVRVQVLCPGLTATEFHMTRGEAPVDAEAAHEPGRGGIRGGMAAADVVTASLAGLALGEVVCAPGLGDAAAVDRLIAAEAGLRTAAGAPLAERYRA